ncbi:Ig-like domain-containing protein [Maribacter ulvicola]|uniref:Pectate lyase n=1 Tax=Maribacter ulvicola TaxID=228959 RepID=A0A1N6VIZ1_9FLAO|nr:hypothetical protein [Maribacter ulvicola]SIQ77696.1 Pectate lyase [Maribacter ulvicola]
MSKFFSFTVKLTLSSFALSLLFSCSKDADLLSEYVITKEDNLQSIALLADDSFYMAPGQNSILMDVLNNDSFSNPANVTIVETSTPSNGNVTINNDNTLTYTPVSEPTSEETSAEETPSPEATPVAEDTFTYTAEVVDGESGTTTKEEATVTITSSDMGELLAFPGAEGFGKYTTGGRGGKVIHVSNLNDDGPGSLREALDVNGPRIIVFDVGGIIQLNDEKSLQIGSTDYTKNVAEENITIAGETAPFPGITITGGGIEIYTSNVIISYITIRPDIATIEANDAIRIRNWGVGGYDQRDIIIDHVSMSHGSDENFNPDGQNMDNTLERVTLQNCLIGENTQQGKAILRGSFVFDLSMLNNYITECDTRNPLVGYGANGENLEFINNIIYGYESGAELSRGNHVDLISNVYESFNSDPSRYNVITWDSQGYGNPEGSGALFVNGNFISGPKEQGANDYNSQLQKFNASNRVITNSLITSWETEKKSIENKVLSTVGNSIFRDELDRHWIDTYYKKNGIFGYTTPPFKSASLRLSDYDTDRDGMADDWERNYFGNLSASATGDHNNDGYTNIEMFLFSLK